MALLRDGFSTTIAASSFPALFGTALIEKEVQPYGYDAGGPIECTTMRNTRFRTRAAKTLIDTEGVTITALYDPALLVASVLPAVGITTAWTITFPDGTLRVFYGFLDKFTPQTHKEGELPLAEVKIVMTNRIGALFADVGPA